MNRSKFGLDASSLLRFFPHFFLFETHGCDLHLGIIAALLKVPLGNPPLLVNSLSGAESTLPVRDATDPELADSPSFSASSNERSLCHSRGDVSGLKVICSSHTGGLVLFSQDVAEAGRGTGDSGGVEY